MSRSLTPQDLQDHRATIAFEVRTVLSAYFQPHEADEIKTSQLAWWCDELQDWEHRQVVWGLRQWNRDNPRIRPTPGDIVSVLVHKRGKAVAARAAAEKAKAAPPPIAPRTPLTLEGRARIAQEMGLPDLTDIFATPHTDRRDA